MCHEFRFLSFVCALFVGNGVFSSACTKKDCNFTKWVYHGLLPAWEMSIIGKSI